MPSEQGDRAAAVHDYHDLCCMPKGAAWHLLWQAPLAQVIHPFSCMQACKSGHAVRFMCQIWMHAGLGFIPGVIYAGLSWSLYFTAYNRAKQRYQGLYDTQRLAAPLHLASAAEAGVLVSSWAPSCLLGSDIRQRISFVAVSMWKVHGSCLRAMLEHLSSIPDQRMLMCLGIADHKACKMWLPCQAIVKTQHIS